jgi:oligopeptide transport system substrate-binding protein
MSPLASSALPRPRRTFFRLCLHPSSFILHPFRRRALLLLTLSLFAAAGCGPHTQRADLVFDNGAEPETLDPALMTGQLEGRLAYALFEGLLSYRPDGGTQPGVAKSWEISPDGRRYTFHLRNDAFWSNGARVTARDFVASWRRVLTPQTASEYAYQLYYLKNAKKFNDPDEHFTDFSQVGVRAPDDDTLEVELENSTPFFLDLCANMTLLPVPTPTIEKWGDAWIKPEHIVTNGAFLLESWRLNDKIRLKKNPRYWNRDTVRLDSIDVLPISLPNVALNFFASGVCDLIMDKGQAPVTLMGELKKKPYFHSAPFLGNMYLRYNCTRAPFNDVRVRQAFSLIVDKKLIVEKITRAGEIPAYSFTPPGAGGYQPPAPGLGYDPERARRLLAEAGYPGGANFPAVSFLYNDYDVNRFIGIELQNMILRELGVRISLRPQENKAYLRTMSAVDYDIARSSWIGDYNDPNTFLDTMLAGGGNNRTGWSDPAYDALIADAAKEQDKEKRFEIFRRAETMLITEQAPLCPLYYYVGIQLYDDNKLGGIQPNVIDEHPLKAIYLKKRP